MRNDCSILVWNRYHSFIHSYKLVGTQLGLFTTFHVFFFQFIFVLPARYVHMRNFTGKSKQTQVVYILGAKFSKSKRSYNA